MKKHQFSMIEILVVIAVTATMSTMLITSIKTSKDIAKQATCMSNINQIRVISELFRKDNGQLPYSDVWLTDFRFAEDYINEGTDLDAFICPGSDDEALTSTEDLMDSTSYYYLPSINRLVEDMADASVYGIDLLDIPQLRDMDQLVIYDKSPDHHNGKVNAAYLYSDDTSKADLEGQIVTVSDITNLPSVDGSGNLVLEDPTSYGSLNINPAQSDGNIFTLTDLDGNEIEIKDGSESVGSATTVTIKVKAQGKTLNVGGESIELDTNTTYDIEAVGDAETSDDDAYFNYELTQDGNGSGQWWLELFMGEGSIEVTNTTTGDSTIVENKTNNGNGNGNGN